MPATGRSLIESYDNAMKRFDLKLKRGYRYVANPVREGAQTHFLFMKIWTQIMENIEKREKEGIS